MKQKHLVAILVALYLLNRGYYYVQTFPGLAHYQFSWKYFFYMAVWFFGATVLVRFMTTGWQSSRLLQIYLVFIEFGQLLMLILLLADGHSRHFQYLWLPTAATIGGFYCLIVLRQAHAAVIEPAAILEPGQGKAHIFRLAPTGARLANFLLDLTMLLLIMVMHNEFVNSFISDITANAGARQLLHRLFWPLAFFVYYLFFESIIGTSTGKLITNTVIVDKDGKLPSFGKRLIRTFCRLIPFDGLTFLLDTRGWHDAFSGTFVTPGKYEPL
jgi:hypothetical protein